MSTTTESTVGRGSHLIDSVRPRIAERAGFGPATALLCGNLFLCAVFSTAPSPAAAAPSRHYRRCRPPEFSFPGDTLWAAGTSCRTARHVISSFQAEAQAVGPHLTVHGFHCTAVSDLGGEPAITCRRGEARIVLHGLQG